MLGWDVVETDDSAARMPWISPANRSSKRNSSRW